MSAAAGEIGESCCEPANMNAEETHAATATFITPNPELVDSAQSIRP